MSALWAGLKAFAGKHWQTIALVLAVGALAWQVRNQIRAAGKLDGLIEQLQKQVSALDLRVQQYDSVRQVADVHYAHDTTIVHFVDSIPWRVDTVTVNGKTEVALPPDLAAQIEDFYHGAKQIIPDCNNALATRDSIISVQRVEIAVLKEAKGVPDLPHENRVKAFAGSVANDLLKLATMDLLYNGARRLTHFK